MEIDDPRAWTLDVYCIKLLGGCKPLNLPRHGMTWLGPVATFFWAIVMIEWGCIGLYGLSPRIGLFHDLGLGNSELHWIDSFLAVLKHHNFAT